MAAVVSDESSCNGPLPTLEEVLKCQFSSWYERFSNLPQRRKNVTIASQVIDLPNQFRDYLLADGLTIPKGAKTSSCTLNEDAGDWSTGSDSSTDAVDDVGEHDDQHSFAFSFPQLNQQINAAIEALGGAVMPKLNWSSPKDATWVNGGTLKCQTDGDVYVLIKASDFCAYDVQHATQQVQNPNANVDVPLQLVLRKWCTLNPSQEFRCFVREGSLCAISQRQHSQYFEHLVMDRELYHTFIEDFFQNYIKDGFDLENYVFDCYVDKKQRVWLLDLNIWGKQTDSLLFEWQDLVERSVFEMRVVETAKEVRADPIASYRAPIDTVHIASLIGTGNEFQEFMSMCDRPSMIDAGNNDI